VQKFSKGQVSSRLFCFQKWLGVKDFESLWLMALQWFVNKQCIFSNAEASVATRLWILLKFMNSSALTATVLERGQKCLTKECRIGVLLCSLE